MIGFLAWWSWLAKQIVDSGKNEYRLLLVLFIDFLYYSSGKPISRCEANAQDTIPSQNTFN
ncbi:hypothetical protein T12_6088 [Trichinella patagoniensis]|uniref:Uncharacterized protein n=1 Tax=Trichinella patagoniensis TaxID=990121 RepID=A0A0V0ZIN9_9BILA|nr:hypothetical protein T12_6088 [Trichinella patagoniensis]